MFNSSDYSDIEPDVLKTYKRDYFIEDLIDYGLNPKDYKILTIKGCQKQGINPYDDTQWTNE